MIFLFNSYCFWNNSDSCNFVSNKSLFAKYFKAVFGPHFGNTDGILSLGSPVTILQNRSQLADPVQDFCSVNFLNAKLYK